MQKRSGAAAGRGRATARPRTLAIDVGGTGLKASVLDPRGGMITDRLRVATPAPAPAKVLVDALVGLVAPLGGFERVSIGHRARRQRRARRRQGECRPVPGPPNSPDAYRRG